MSQKVKPLLCILLLAISVCVLYSLFYYKNGFTGFADKTGVDVAYYINLEHRLDRKEEILGEMSRIGFPMEKVERIDAVYDKDRGHLGCSKSHIKTLERFIASGHSNCIVLEDDFEFVNPETALVKINDVFDKQIQFDGAWEKKVIDRILHNLSLLFERSFESVQDLNRYRKEANARLVPQASPAV
jgi:hypothetical protein